MSVEVIAFVSVKPGQEDAFVAAARHCIASSRAESGVFGYYLWRKIEGEQRFVFDELYVDDAAAQTHTASDHFNTFGRSARDCATARSSITALSDERGRRGGVVIAGGDEPQIPCPATKPIPPVQLLT